MTIGSVRLLGAELLSSMPDAPVLLVESDAAFKVARRLLPDWAVLSWSGDSVALSTADWSLFNGRAVFFFHPFAMVDMGQTAVSIGIGLQSAGVTPVNIFAPSDWPEGSGLEHAGVLGWTGPQLLDCIRRQAVWSHDAPLSDPDNDLKRLVALEQEAIREMREREAPQSDDLCPPDLNEPVTHEVMHEGELVDEPAAGRAARRVDTEVPFKFLGFNRGTFYYLPRNSRQVVSMTAAAHSKNNLISIAGLDFWCDRFAARGKEKFSMDEAIHWMMQSNYHRGIYDTMRVRGRGAWWDNGRAVLHCGDKLIVDGLEEQIDEMDTQYIYESASKLDVQMDSPLSKTQANKFAKLCAQLNFERPIQARFLAGFCVLAPIGGALAWRPHAYIVGESGSGKSWVMKNIVGDVLDTFGINIAGDTTEAAIRQTLMNDALPVIYDEADKDTEKGRDNMDNFLGLIRTSSSDGRSMIIKGGANGQAQSFNIRSCFLLASIGLPVTKQSDQSRITILTLKKNAATAASAAAFAKLASDTRELITSDYVRRFHARCIKMIPVIRENARIFAAAAAQAIGTQRLGDQYGALLAGAYSLYSDSVVSLEMAQQWVNEQAWEESTAGSDDKDQLQCLRYIAQSVIRTDHGERSVAELVELATETFTESYLTATDAFNTLRRYGILLGGGAAPDYKWVTISNTSVPLARLLKGTSWEKNWGTILARIDGATKSAPKRYEAGETPSRGVTLPVAALMGH